MIYTIYPGCIIPHLAPGDSCVIGGIEFPYIGEFAKPTDIPPGVKGVFKNTTTQEYVLRHDQSDTEIIQEFNQNYLNKITESNIPIPRVKLIKDVFTVPINPNDGYLKVIIKQILQEKQIDLHDYKMSFDSDNHMNNMKRLLIGDANLTYEKFREWLNILGYDHSIVVYRPDGSVFEPPNNGC